MKKMIIDEESVLKEVIAAEKELHKISNHAFTTKGYVKLIVNIIEDRLNRR